MVSSSSLGLAEQTRFKIQELRNKVLFAKFEPWIYIYCTYFTSLYSAFIPGSNGSANVPPSDTLSGVDNGASV